jgi:hypothetical protein
LGPSARLVPKAAPDDTGHCIIVEVSAFDHKGVARIAWGRAQRLGPTQEWIAHSEGCKDDCSDQHGNAYCDERQEKLGHLLGRSQFAAVQPGHVRSNWVVLSQQHALARRTFECPHNGAGRAGFETGQRHASSAPAATRSLDRNKRWLDGIGTKCCHAVGLDCDNPSSLAGRPRVCGHLSTQAEVRRGVRSQSFVKSLNSQ